MRALGYGLHFLVERPRPVKMAHFGSHYTLKGGDTVLGRNNLKHLEWHVNNDGKKIKIILIFLR